MLKAQPCGVLRGARPFTAPGASAHRLARTPRAGDGPTTDGPSTSGAGVQNKEAELERLEAAIRGKGPAPAPAATRPPSAGMSGTKSGAKPIPIRGMTQQQASAGSCVGVMPGSCDGVMRCVAKGGHGLSPGLGALRRSKLECT